MNNLTAAESATTMTEQQIEQLVSALHALTDECAVALMEGRIGAGDAAYLGLLAGQARLFIRPPDGLEPPPVDWSTRRYGRLSKIPPLAVLAPLRRCGFTDGRIASLLGCSRTLVVQRRAGKDVRRPSARTLAPKGR